MKEKIFLNKNLEFHHTPFGGITIEELPQIIVPKSFFPRIKSLIKSTSPTIIELVGKQGRGKTTHLNFLHQNYPEFPISSFSNHNNTFPNELWDNEIILLDNIHHLSIRERIKIFRHFKKVILTTHQTRFLEYKWARVKHQSFYCKGLEKEDLKKVIENRIHSASNQIISEKIQLNENYLSQLVATFKDDFRGILNHLYENFE